VGGFNEIERNFRTFLSLERTKNMNPDNDICNCESCERLRNGQDHDPYFSDRDEFDRVQEESFWPEPDFDGDLLDLI
jgi:hypothetical protein